jgi:2-haloacid dehalogenase
LLQTFSEILGLQLGIITNIPDDMSTGDVRTLLAAARLLTPLNSALIITSRDAGVSKPDVKIYEFAARSAGIPTNQCLYIGEDAAEVAGAQAAGMGGLLKPVPPG